MSAPAASIPFAPVVGDGGSQLPVESTPVQPGALSPTTERAAKSMLWSVVENGGFALLSFIALVVYSRYLDAAAFGLFSIALALVELLGLLVTMLFHDALVQRERVTELHYDTAFTFTLGLSIVLATASALGAPLLAELVGRAEAAPVLQGLSLCFPATALAATLVARQRRELEFRALAVRTLVGRFAGAVIGIGAVLAGAGVWGLVAQQLVVALVGSVVLWFAAPARMRPRLRLGLTELRELSAFGAYAVGSMFLSFAVKRLFVVVAGVLLGAELAGYLNLSFRAVDVLWSIAAVAISQVALPLFSRLQGERERLLVASRRATEFACLALYPPFFGIALVAPELVEVLFGARWLPSAPYVTVLASLVLVRASGLLFGPILTALGRPRDSLIAVCAELGVMLGLLAIFGTPSLPVAAAIWVARELVAVSIWLLFVKRAGFSLSALLGGAVAPLLASAVMAAVVSAVRLALPADLAPAIRLTLLVVTGALGFLLGARVLGGELLARAVGLARSALTRKVRS